MAALFHRLAAFLPPGRGIFPFLLFLLPALGAPMGITAAQAQDGVVWLTLDSSGQEERVRFAAPLEWLASIDDEEFQRKARVAGIHIDANALWKEHRRLAIGSSLEVERGTTEDGEPFVVFLRSLSPHSKAAEGKLHIMSRDKEGQVADIRFPLDLPALLANLLSFLDVDVEVVGKGADVEIPARAALRKLGDYGPFTLLEMMGTDGQVEISIE
jgi:hypothetical protein